MRGLNEIDRAEEIAELTRHRDDEKSSCAGLADDISPGIHSLKVDTSRDDADRCVRELARCIIENLAGALALVIDQRSTHG